MPKRGLCPAEGHEARENNKTACLCLRVTKVEGKDLTFWLKRFCREKKSFLFYFNRVVGLFLAFALHF